MPVGVPSTLIPDNGSTVVAGPNRSILLIVVPFTKPSITEILSPSELAT
jgi:hypothetical protein